MGRGGEERGERGKRELSDAERRGKRGERRDLSGW